MAVKEVLYYRQHCKIACSWNINAPQRPTGEYPLSDFHEIFRFLYLGSGCVSG